jgi:hypothetical protein
VIFSEAHGPDFDLIVCGTPGPKSAHRFPGEHVNCEHDPEGADDNPFAADSDPFRCVCPVDPHAGRVTRAAADCPAHQARYAAQQFASDNGSSQADGGGGR